MSLLTPYKNLGWDSNVVAYENGADFIVVQFWNSKPGSPYIYTYTYMSASQLAIEEMKKLALTWHWLNSYIWTHRPKYLSKR